MALRGWPRNAWSSSIAFFASSSSPWAFLALHVRCWVILLLDLLNTLHRIEDIEGEKDPTANMERQKAQAEFAEAMEQMEELHAF